MPRGRPKHPDILTPREWQVLDLIREGLTNEQIARRLGISENGAKYHVMEILSKLGVSSRYEAAAWQREPATVSRRFAGLVAIFALRPKLSAFTASKVLAKALIVSVFATMTALAIGVVVMNQRAARDDPSADVTAITGALVTTMEPSTQPTSTPHATVTPDSPGATGVIAPPPGTAVPTATPPASATHIPSLLTELPAGATDALQAFAVSQDATYAGACSSGTPQGSFCYNTNDGTPTLEGTNIRVFLRVYLQSLSFQVLLAPTGTGAYTVEEFSGPNAFSLPPP